jgi:hypothetical protein
LSFLISDIFFEGGDARRGDGYDDYVEEGVVEVGVRGGGRERESRGGSTDMDDWDFFEELISNSPYSSSYDSTSSGSTPSSSSSSSGSSSRKEELKEGHQWEKKPRVLPLSSEPTIFITDLAERKIYQEYRFEAIIMANGNVLDIN